MPEGACPAGGFRFSRSTSTRCGLTGRQLRVEHPAHLFRTRRFLINSPLSHNVCRSVLAPINRPNYTVPNKYDRKSERAIKVDPQNTHTHTDGLLFIRRGGAKTERVFHGPSGDETR